jgi:hypothetical protein
VSEDLDRSGTRPSFELFLRLLDEPRSSGLLWGDLSALTQSNRCGEPLRYLLEHPELHPRLINGSDYPLCAIHALVRTGKLVSLGYLTREERVLLNEVDQHNPLWFDLAVKRTLRAPGGGGGFSLEVFLSRPGLFPGV